MKKNKWNNENTNIIELIDDYLENENINESNDYLNKSKSLLKKLFVKILSEKNPDRIKYLSSIVPLCSNLDQNPQNYSKINSMIH